MRHYTGVGSRSTPEAALATISWLAVQLAHKHYTVCSGGAQGADSAFAQGVRCHLRNTGQSLSAYQEIYLPGQKFNGFSPSRENGYISAPTLPNWKQALGITETLHPALPVYNLYHMTDYEALVENLELGT